jgi:hypothetical protein
LEVKHCASSLVRRSHERAACLAVAAIRSALELGRARGSITLLASRTSRRHHHEF